MADEEILQFLDRLSHRSKRISCYANSSHPLPYNDMRCETDIHLSNSDTPDRRVAIYIRDHLGNVIAEAAGPDIRTAVRLAQNAFTRAIIKGYET